MNSKAELLGGLGSLMLTFGTLCVYAAFAATQKKLQLVSDMFQHWPLAGGLTFGLGNTMLGLALCCKDNMYAVTLCMASAWAVVTSSEYYGQEWIRIAHFASTLVFLWTSYLVYTSCVLCKGWVSGILVFFSFLILLCGLVMGSSSAIEPPIVWRQTMAVSELVLLSAYGVGYVQVFFLAHAETGSAHVVFK